jgi:hypothetical protein
MNSRFLATGLSLTSLTFMFVESAQAAQFQFGYGSSTSFDSSGQGGLFFQSSPLTGIGLETVQLSQLQSISFFTDFKGQPDIAPGGRPLLSSYDRSSVSFNFNNGELMGLNFSTSTSFRGIGSSGGAIFGSKSVDGIYDLLVQGDRYEQRFTGFQVVSVFNASTGTFSEIRTDHQNQLFASGSVNFRTIERVQAVPEPATMLGISAATGLGAIFRRRLNQRTAK